MKRVLYLASIIGAIVLVAGVFYFLRYRAEEPGGAAPVPPGGLPQAPPQKIPAPPLPQTPEGGTPPKEPSGAVVQPGEQKFGVVAHNEVLSYFVDGQNNAIVVQPDGQIIKITRGEASALSSSAISNLMKAEFSYDGKRILAAFGPRSNPEYSVFNVETKSWKPLASGIKSAAWSPTNYRIAYFRNAALSTLDTESAKAAPQEIMKIRMEDADVFWLSPNQLLLEDKPSAIYAGSVWSVNISNKTMAPFAEGQLGLYSSWDQKAGLGIVFRTDLSRRGGRLGLLDAAGNALSDIAFLTLPSKCAFAAGQGAATSTAGQKILYCALPRDQEELGIKTLPDEYIKRSFFTQDNFYQISLADGSIKEVLSGQLVDGEKLGVFGKNLFFVNRLDKKLYAISLE